MGANVGSTGESLGDLGEGVVAIRIDEGAPLQAFEFRAVGVRRALAANAGHEEAIPPLRVGDLVERQRFDPRHPASSLERGRFDRGVLRHREFSLRFRGLRRGLGPVEGVVDVPRRCRGKPHPGGLAEVYLARGERQALRWIATRSDSPAQELARSPLQVAHALLHQAERGHPSSSNSRRFASGRWRRMTCQLV